MPHRLTLELPEDVYQPVVQAAEQVGQTPEQWAVAQLRACVPSAKAHAVALAKLMRHAGAVDLGYATGAENEKIDADLAKEYSGQHEEGA